MSAKNENGLKTRRINSCFFEAGKWMIPSETYNFRGDQVYLSGDSRQTLAEHR